MIKMTTRDNRCYW